MVPKVCFALEFSPLKGIWIAICLSSFFHQVPVWKRKIFVQKDADVMCESGVYHVLYGNRSNFGCEVSVAD